MEPSTSLALSDFGSTDRCTQSRFTAESKQLEETGKALSLTLRVTAGDKRLWPYEKIISPSMKSIRKALMKHDTKTTSGKKPEGRLRGDNHRINFIQTLLPQPGKSTESSLKRHY